MLTNFINGIYKFELPLTDEKNNVFIETITIKLMVMVTTYVVGRNIEDYEFLDIPIHAKCVPCQNFLRVYSIEIEFVGEKNSMQHLTRWKDLATWMEWYNASSLLGS